MTKILIFIALICVASVSLQDFKVKKKLDYIRRANGGAQMLSKLCSNATLAQLVLTKIRQFITTLETNGSYTEVLARHTQAIAYIKSDTNAALLTSNCMAYFIGFDNARKADNNGGELEGYFAANANDLLREILPPFPGSRNFDFF